MNIFRFGSTIKLKLINIFTHVLCIYFLILFSGCGSILISESTKAYLSGNYALSIQILENELKELNAIAPQLTKEKYYPNLIKRLTKSVELTRQLYITGKYEKASECAEQYLKYVDDITNDQIKNTYINIKSYGYVGMLQFQLYTGKMQLLSEATKAYSSMGNFEKAGQYAEKFLILFNEFDSIKNQEGFPRVTIKYLAPLLANIFEALSKNNNNEMQITIVSIFENIIDDNLVTNASGDIIDIKIGTFDEGQMLPIIKSLAFAYYRQGKYEKAINYQNIFIKKQLEYVGKVNMINTLFLITPGIPIKWSAFEDELFLAKCYLALGNKYKAESILTEIRINTLNNWPELLSSTRTWEYDYVMGLVKLENNDIHGAELSFKSSIEKNETLRTLIYNSQNRIQYDDTHNDIYDSIINVLLLQNKIGEAFDYSEKARARSFLDMLGSTTIKPSKGVDQLLIQRRIQILEQQEASEHQVKIVDDSQTKNHIRGIELIEKELKHINKEISTQFPEFGSLLSANVLSWKELQKVIENDIKLVEYYQGKDKIHIWILDNKSINYRSIEIERSQTEDLIKNFRKETTTRRLSAFPVYSNELYNLLIKPIEKDLSNITRVCIVPHGSLHQIPFQALFDGKNYFVENKVISYVPSANVLTFCIKKNRPINFSLLAFGNPDLGDKRYDLPYSKMEILDISKLFSNSEVFYGSRANKQALLKNISNYSMIHLATHGNFNPVKPMQSGLMLSNVDRGISTLTVEEIFNLRINSSLVTLSACETGLGKSTRGDELIGLSRAFIYAGTPSLISSLWEVDDQATSLLMKAYYSYLFNNDKATSMQKAQLDLMKIKPSPFFWSTFILIGDWN